MNLLSIVGPWLDNICQIKRKWYYLSGWKKLQTNMPQWPSLRGCIIYTGVVAVGTRQEVHSMPASGTRRMGKARYEQRARDGWTLDWILAGTPLLPCPCDVRGDWRAPPPAARKRNDWGWGLGEMSLVQGLCWARTGGLAHAWPSWKIIKKNV
jgi:hypothetical protein